MQTYEPADFLSKLAANGLPRLSTPSDLSIVGLVKSDTASPLTVQFSYSPACERWLSIPIEIVESIDHIKTIACKDHEHPLVRVKITRPDQDRKDLTFLYDLVTETQTTLALMHKAASAKRRLTSTQASRLTDFCFIWDDPAGVMVCCFHGDDLECTGIV